MSRDITMQQLPDAQHESEARLRSFIESSFDVIFILNTSGIFRFVSPSWELHFGYPISEILDHPFIPFVHPDDVQPCFEYLSRVLASGQAGTSPPYRVKCADGSWKLFIANGTRFIDVKGEVLYHGIGRDITEQKCAEERLKASEEKFFKAFNHAPLLMSISTMDTGRYLEVNESFCNTSGYGRAEIINQTSTALGWISASARDRILRELERNGRVLDMELNLTARDGRSVYCLYSAETITVAGKQCLLSIAQDISMRKQTENALLESETRYRHLVEHSSAWIWSVDPSLRHTYSNSYIEEALGYPLPQFMGMSSQQLIHPDDFPLVQAIVEAARTQQKSWKGNTIRWRHRDGSWKYFESSGYPVFSDTGEFIGLNGVDVDVTDRILLQQEREKAQRLESLGVLAGGIAHDFNNILTSILGNISIARMMVGDDHKAFQRLIICEKAAKRAADLTHQLITFARGGEPMRKATNTRHLFDESLSLALRGSHVNVTVTCPGDIRWLDADASQMTQVFNNLLINARQAMPEGGGITVSMENADIHAGTDQQVKPGPYVRIVITDQGCGISEENLPRIFDPYFTTKQKGTGLGLASVYSIIKRHGGVINVMSHPGEGCSFSLLLPAAEPQEHEDHVFSPGISAMLGKGTVLVMDDEALIRDLATVMLDELGYRIQLCCDGEQAVALHAASRESGAPYAAIILDLTVQGGMGGREAAARIRSVDPKVPLIVSSGYSNDAVIAECHAFGFSGMIKKPYTMEELAQELQSVINNRT